MACWDARDESMDTLPAPAFVLAKRCGCGATYDETSWRQLDYVGAQFDGCGGVLTLRNCAFCRSTLGRLMEEETSP